MEPIFEATLDAMRHDVTRLERIATNVANVATSGYKREILVQRAAAPTPTTFAKVYELRAEASDGGHGAGSTAEVSRDMRSGTLKPTGQPLDLALTGPGYFELATDRGAIYTRNGRFHLDSRGRVVNADGHALVGKGGEITLTGSDVTIDEAGKVRQSGRLVDQVQVVDFAPGSTVVPRGGGAFEIAGTPRALDESALRVRQGHLENSNVDPAHEMVNLMQTMRHFESMQRVAQVYDDMLGAAIRKLGEV
jgi:flagellar basal-body rod protein FlgF